LEVPQRTSGVGIFVHWLLIVDILLSKLPIKEQGGAAGETLKGPHKMREGRADFAKNLCASFFNKDLFFSASSISMDSAFKGGGGQRLKIG
jgi:hypothetical protein